MSLPFLPVPDDLLKVNCGQILAKIGQNWTRRQSGSAGSLPCREDEAQEAVLSSRLRGA